MFKAPISLLSPAKINLFLAVTGKRSDGYHDIISVMIPLTLADKMDIRTTRRDITIACSHPEVPDDHTNLAYRAAVLFFKTWAKDKKGHPFGLHIAIDKRIPVAAGLGGGSSNAASMLLALNRICGHPYRSAELAAMAIKLGADVPFFIYQQAAIATGIGEILQPVTGDLCSYAIVLVNPSLQISTANVYQSLNLRLTKCLQHLKNPSLCIGGEEKSILPEMVENCLCNDLELVTLIRYPVIKQIKQTLTRYGANGTLMSGSGPTVFGLFRDKALADRTIDDLREKYPWQVFLSGHWVTQK